MFRFRKRRAQAEREARDVEESNAFLESALCDALRARREQAANSHCATAQQQQPDDLIEQQPDDMEKPNALPEDLEVLVGTPQPDGVTADDIRASPEAQHAHEPDVVEEALQPDEVCVIITTVPDAHPDDLCAEPEVLVGHAAA